MAIKKVSKKITTKKTVSRGEAKSTKKKTTVKKVVAKKTDTKSEYVMYHKPNCSTSRTVLELLHKKKIKPEIVKYIETPPTEKELEKLLAKLHIKPFDLIRQKEKYFQEKLKGLKLNDHEWIKEMVENPVLIERPIIIKGNKAIIGRPIEKVIDFI